MSETNFSIAIRNAHGERQVHDLKAGETILGCDTASDIQVSGDPALLPRHVLMAPRQEACWVSTTRGAPLWGERGQAVEGEFVPWGARLRLGGLEFHLQDRATSSAATGDQKVGNQEGSGTDTGRDSGKAHPLILMLLISTLALCGFTFLSGKSPATTYVPAADPTLFADSITCSSDNHVHRAALAEHSAEAKSERSVFDLQDGVSAVALYQEAASCYQLAGSDRAASMRSRADELRGLLLEDYRVTRLRLERALASGDHEQASKQVARLQELLRHQPQSESALTLRRLALNLSRKK